MDVCKSEKRTAVDTSRPPLLPAERNTNAAETTTKSRRPQMREVTSRYKSPISPRRATSPNISRTVSASSQLAPKRAVSAERRRPSMPPSPSSPSFTPVRDSSIDVQLASRKLSVGSRLPESLWPSTMRSLSVSFQSDSISIPVSKKEKPPPVSNASDRTLRPSSNVGKKQVDLRSQSRKSTAERKRSPLKGKNLPGQSENSKPLDGVHSRLIDQHRWPSRIGGKVSSNSLNRSVDLTGKTLKAPATSTGVGLSSLRRNPVLDSSSKLLQKSNSDAARLLSEELCRTRPKANPVDDRLSLATDLEKLATSLSERMSQATPAARSFFSSGSRPASPSRISVSRGVSPPRSRPSTPPSRGVSPSRVRPSSGTTQSSSSSVLSFIVDVKKGKKGASYIEEAHHLRLLHNRYLQWRFANAKAEAVLFIQKVMDERTLYNVWEATSALWESVVRKRINLQKLNLELRLNAVLNDQMIFLDNWATLEKDHLDSLSGTVEDLQASTIRLPVTGGAKADIESLRLAICSAVDVMQAMGSSMCSSLSKVENMNALVSELASMAAQERAMLDECKAILDSTAAMQVEEYSSRTHLIQINNISKKQSL